MWNKVWTVGVKVVGVVMVVGMVGLGWETWTVVRGLNEMVVRGNRVMEVYERSLTDGRQVKAVEAGLAAAASWQATARLVNTQVVPQMVGALREIERATVEVRGTARKGTRVMEVVGGEVEVTGVEVRAMVGEVRTQVEGVGLGIKGVVDRVEKVAERVEEVAKGVEGAVDEGGMALGEVREVLEDVKVVTENLAEASKEAPAVARGVEKVVGRAPIYQKLAAIGGLVLGIVGVVR